MSTAKDRDDSPDAALPEAATPALQENAELADDGLEALWENVLARWDDDKAHAAFLQYAQRGMHLPEAGARYRRIKDGEPERAEMAQKQLQALMVLALALLQERQQEPVTGPPRWLTVVTFVLALAALAFLARQVLGSS